MLPIFKNRPVVQISCLFERPMLTLSLFVTFYDCDDIKQG